MLTFPKDTAQFSWTRHIKNKMVFYHLSGAQLLRIFRKPDRREEGVAPETIGAMKTKKASGAKVARSEEIWILYKLNAKKKDTANKTKSRITMISAWRYPGVTKKGERLPIPDEIVKELEQESY